MEVKHPSANYGALSGEPVKPFRYRIGHLAIVECVLVPWGLFVALVWMLSFSVRYEHPHATAWLALSCCLVPVAFALRVWYQLHDRTDPSHREPNWFLFLAASSTLACCLGLAIGEYNFATNMNSYYDRADLGSVKNVDTRKARGGQYLDISSIGFTAATYVDEKLSMAFKDGDLYCVAPIISGDTLPASYEQSATSANGTYDFWAVGVNCCNPTPPAQFACGSPPIGDEDPGGLRLMDDSEIPYFRTAIQMAQEEFKMLVGNTPLLVSWLG
ncbi:unnamed protein product, partial [Polarella glacialis]